MHQKPLCNCAHWQIRLKLCQARSTWNLTEWSRIAFRDEFRFENKYWGSAKICLETGHRIFNWLPPATPADNYDPVIKWVSFHSIAGPLWVLSGTPFQRDRTQTTYYGSLCCPSFFSPPGVTFHQDNVRLNSVIISNDCLVLVEHFPGQLDPPGFSAWKHVLCLMKRQHRLSLVPLM